MKKYLTDEEKISLIYQSLEEVEELIFLNVQDKMKFNKYMLYLNYLEEKGKVELKILENWINKQRKIIVTKK